MKSAMREIAHAENEDPRPRPDDTVVDHIN
jgi:hypothetical protein